MAMAVRVMVAALVAVCLTGAARAENTASQKVCIGLLIDAATRNSSLLSSFWDDGPDLWVHKIEDDGSVQCMFRNDKNKYLYLTHLAGLDEAFAFLLDMDSYFVFLPDR